MRNELAFDSEPFSGFTIFDEAETQPAAPPDTRKAVDAAIARGVTSEPQLTDMVFTARHPERRGAKITKQDTALIREWMQIRDTIVRPALLRTRRATSTNSGTIAPGVSRDTIARIDKYGVIIDREAKQWGVNPNIIRGIIAAESAGKPDTGKDGPGYKGLMQAGTDLAQLNPETSIVKGVKHFKLKERSLQVFFERHLKTRWSSLDEDTRLKLIMAGYNAGQETVKRALLYAKQAGDVNRWMEAEHYKRALVSTGAYSVRAPLNRWCVQRLSPEGLAADLARLSGQDIAAVRVRYSRNGAWDVPALVKALIPVLTRENKRRRKARATEAPTYEQVSREAPRSLLCAVEYKFAHTPNYLNRVLAYKRYYDARR